MPYKKSKTRFTELARLSKTNRDWLKQNKDTRTIAGFLDKVINFYKQNH